LDAVVDFMEQCHRVQLQLLRSSHLRIRQHQQVVLFIHVRWLRILTAVSLSHLSRLHLLLQHRHGQHHRQVISWLLRLLQGPAAYRWTLPVLLTDSHKPVRHGNLGKAALWCRWWLGGVVVRASDLWSAVALPGSLGQLSLPSPRGT